MQKMPPGVCWAGKGQELKAGEEEELVQLMASAGRASDVPGLGMSQARSSSPGFPGDEKGPELAELQLHTHPCIPVHPCSSLHPWQQHCTHPILSQHLRDTATPSTAGTAPGEVTNSAPDTPNSINSKDSPRRSHKPGLRSPKPSPRSPKNSINSRDSLRRSHKPSPSSPKPSPRILKLHQQQRQPQEKSQIPPQNPKTSLTTRTASESQKFNQPQGQLQEKPLGSPFMTTWKKLS